MTTPALKDNRRPHPIWVGTTITNYRKPTVDSAPCPSCDSEVLGPIVRHEGSCTEWRRAERVLAEDAYWFRHHDGRSCRPRMATPEEYLHVRDSLGWLPIRVIVQRIGPGMYSRRFIGRAGKLAGRVDLGVRA